MAVIDQYNFISNKVDKITNNSSIKKPEIVVITKKINYSDIIPLINLGHIHYGESKVQEAIDKWKLNLVNNSNIKLHMIGRIQSNKVDQVCGFFDYIHSLDSLKLANAIYKFEEKNKKKAPNISITKVCIAISPMSCLTLPRASSLSISFIINLSFTEA